MSLNVGHIHGCRNARFLKKLDHVVVNVMVLFDQLDVAFEVRVIDSIKTNQRGEQSPVSFCDLITSQVAVAL